MMRDATYVGTMEEQMTIIHIDQEAAGGQSSNINASIQVNQATAKGSTWANDKIRVTNSTRLLIV